MTTPVLEVRSFQVSIPAGTAITSPQVTPITFPARDVAWVHWKVPPGPSGKMGWRLSMSGGVAVIPTGGGWVIADGEDATWQVTNQPDSGFWEVTGYNTGIYPHTVYLDFGLNMPGGPVPPVALIPGSQLSQPLPAAAPGG